MEVQNLTFDESYLVINENLHWIVSPFYENQLICLTWDRIGERCPHSRWGIGLQPHAHGQGIHLRQAFFHFCIHVVGPQRECKLKFIQGSVFSLTCWHQIDYHYLCFPFLFFKVYILLNTDKSLRLHTTSGFILELHVTQQIHGSKAPDFL